VTTQPGFIAIARGILNHPTIGAGKHYSDFEAWLWLLFNAAYKPVRVSITNGRAREIIELQRGQLTHARSYLAPAWGWTEKRVRGFLFRLEKDGLIVRQTGHLQTLITICNYERYQNPEIAKGRQSTPQNGQQRAGKGPEEEQSNKETKDNSDVGPYFFESGAIRLSKKDFEKWKDAFQHLDLKAELLALTPWAEQQGKQWFFAVSGALAKRNREQKVKLAQSSTNGGFRHGPNDPNAGIT
jgi:hypothetical protein